jgi:rhodanese-related sulfurtransferase
MAHAAGGAVFVDVREPDEWAEGHIPGALHIPLADLPQRAAELPTGTDLILVCRSGARSYVATEFLIRSGVHRAANLAGGMLAWEDERHPVIR